MGRSLKDATGNTTTVPTPVTPGTTYRRPHYQKQLLFTLALWCALFFVQLFVEPVSLSNRGFQC